jgi:hypothetical protein
MIAMLVLKFRVNKDVGHVFATPKVASKTHKDEAITESLFEFCDGEVGKLMGGGWFG